ncbi:hypothetical protein G9A89_012567 [Geosiphon pyriformis]|nr:hypothetical protein G9A89_012567 [Geosiphon pyriformis]
MVQYLESTMIILCVLIAAKNTHAAIYTPGKRWGHTANLIENKIYILGGADATNQTYQDFFYLDLSVNFTISAPAFILNKKFENFTGLNLATSVVKDNKSIYIYGGVKSTSNDSQEISSAVFEINPNVNSTSLTKNTSIEELTFSGSEPQGRYGTQAVITNSSQIVVWGGLSNDNRTWICDPEARTWRDPKPSKSPKPKIDFTATYLPDGRVIYIGGTFVLNEKFSDINQIWTYNTIKNEWTNYTAKGDMIQPRAKHSAVLDGQHIIIYGGISEPLLTEKNSLAVLDTIDFSWKQPNIQNPQYGPQQVPNHHSSTLYNNQMIVTFGQAEPEKLVNSVYVMDTKDQAYAWVPSYVPSPVTIINVSFIYFVQSTEGKT